MRACKHEYACMHSFKWTKQRTKLPEYYHMICIGKTKCTSRKGLFYCGTHPLLNGAIIIERKLIKTLFIVTVVSLILLLPLPLIDNLFVYFSLKESVETMSHQTRWLLLYSVTFSFFFQLFHKSIAIIWIAMNLECQSSKELWFYYCVVDLNSLGMTCKLRDCTQLISECVFIKYVMRNWENSRLIWEGFTWINSKKYVWNCKLRLVHSNILKFVVYFFILTFLEW